MIHTRALTGLALLLGIFLSSAAAAADTRRDGNWWLTLDEAHKAGYVSGFYDGMGLGGDFATWKIQKSASPIDAECVSKMVDSTNTYYKKYVKGTTPEQLVDGLNAFYGDDRNRGIGMQGGVWLVLAGIAGMPKDELEKKIERWRRAPK